MLRVGGSNATVLRVDDPALGIERDALALAPPPAIGDDIAEQVAFAVVLLEMLPDSP